ncbi:hypothetical protein ACHQM5_006510 [Ranunculus cassubicifolius]
MASAQAAVAEAHTTALLHEIEELHGDIGKNFWQFVVSTFFLFGGLTFLRKIALEVGKRHEPYLLALVIAAVLIHLVGAHSSYSYITLVGSMVQSKEEEWRRDYAGGRFIRLGVSVCRIRSRLMDLLCVTIVGALYAFYLLACVYKDYSEVPGKVGASM